MLTLNGSIQSQLRLEKKKTRDLQHEQWLISDECLKKKNNKKKTTLAMKEPWVWVYFNNVILSCRDLHLVAQMNKVEEEEVKEEAMLL